jgi:PTH1 family peptidyl-tRNA hydrolase
MVVDDLAMRFGRRFKAGKGAFFLAEASRKFPAVLVKPTTFMNRSGIAVRQILRAKGISHEEILVVSDDMELPFGRLRIRKFGSAGGHNGLKDIIMRLESDDFPRLRIGIDRPQGNRDGADYVLSKFDRAEAKELPFIVRRASEAVETTIFQGLEAAMNEFNRIKENE